MRFYLAVVVVAALAVFPPVEANFRIIQGRIATALEFPYQAALEDLGVHSCGASIIHPRFILTAAHCLKGFEEYSQIPKMLLRVRAGSDYGEKGGSLHEIARVIPHEMYSESSAMTHHDIGLVELSEPLELSKRANRVPLAKRPPSVGAMGWVTGFGEVKPMKRESERTRYLMAVELPVVDREKCEEKLELLSEDMICAGFDTGSRDACLGDSGGPYVVGGVQVGVVSWGVGCGRDGMPGAYTNVSMYRDWVTQKLKESGASVEE